MTAQIVPLILGKGRAGEAIEKSLAIVALANPELKMKPAQYLPRGADLAKERAKQDRAFLCVAQPHGLHAAAIVDGEGAGFDAILCEKPAAVTLEQVESLRAVKAPVAVLHGYRATWGLQTLRKMIASGELGDIISIEGRYWQSSAASRAIGTPAPLGWKDDIKLAGPYDTYIDIGTHWIDAASFLTNSLPTKIQGRRLFANSPSSHRDTHVQAMMTFGSAAGLASISKTMHGSGNQFEIAVIGSKKSVQWRFLNPDELEIGEGRDRRVLVREDDSFGSGQAAYHGLGWLEGYIEISTRLLRHAYLGEPSIYPQLGETLGVLDAMLRTEWL